MFAICVAAAIGNGKLNLLLQFEQPPSAAQVMSRAVTAFSQLQQDRGIFTPFICNCAMIFDDAASRWVPLERSSQLVHNCQMYLFQFDKPDVAGPIPDPIPANEFLVNYRSPARDDSSTTPSGRSPRGIMPTDPDLSSFQYQQRNAPAACYGSNNYPNNYPNNNYNYSNNNNANISGGTPLSSSRPRGGSEQLSPEQQAEAFHRAAEAQGDVFVAGDSILKDERNKEAQKIKLDVDAHRNRVRDETRRFSDDVSPQRGRN